MSKEDIYIALAKWAQEAKRDLGVERCFVFGSLIHKEGEQFDPQVSDIDLVIEIPSKVDSEVKTVEWLEKLKILKQNLEQKLFILLRRTDTSDPIVSILPVTQEELFFDIHKSKAQNFFSGNKFKCLYSDVIYDGIEGAGEKDVDNNLIRQVIEYCQKNRNEFLYNTIHSDLQLLEWNAEEEVLPKPLIRHSAMISDEAVSQPQGEDKFDLQVGLDHIYNSVYVRRHENSRFKELHNWLSVRRLARGNKEKVASLSQFSHLFLSEVLFGLARNLKETSLVRHQVTNSDELAVGIVKDIEAEPAELMISGEGNIPFSEDELFCFVEQATVNMKWELKPSFKIIVPELIEISNALSEFDAQSVSEKNKKSNLFDRYNRLKKISKELEKGIELLVWFQNYLISHDTKRKECLNFSIRQFCKICFELSLIRASRYGGLLQCYNPESYEESGVFGFSIPKDNRDAFFEKAGIEGIMGLAANNQYVDELPPEIYSLHIVPLLVKHGVDKILLDEMEQDELEQKYFFHISSWKFGPK